MKPKLVQRCETKVDTAACKASYIGLNKKSALKKSHIWEASNLSIYADSSTDTTVGWTKTTQNQKNWKRKKLSQMEKLKNV